ncbi:MAG: hypothetical protein K0B15_00390 [Lentimicrobium sp.]|nr:hypothetical protein [Lentimicrobium sp.]
MKIITLLLIIMGIFFSGCITPLSDKNKNTQSIIIFSDFENSDSLQTSEPVVWKNLSSLQEGHAYSGKIASKLDQQNEFSAVFEAKTGYIAETNPKRFTFQAMVFSPDPFPTAFMVASISGTDFYRSYPISEFLPVAGKWEKVRTSFTLPDSLKPADQLKVYIWNRKKNEVLVDDFSLEFFFEKAGKN